MPTRALTVAMVAGSLLVALVAADVAMNRVYHLEAFVEDRWVKVGSHPYLMEPGVRHAEPSFAAFPLNASDTVQMRVRVDNGYAWAHSETVEVFVDGRPAFEGRLDAPARGEGEAGFTLAGADVFLGPSGAWRERVPGENVRVQAPHFEVVVGGDFAFYGGIAFREVPK